MSKINTLALESNRKIKINFDGGDLFSDAGLLLIKEFVSKLLLRSDSGSATPELYKQCTGNGVSYVIQLKEKAIFKKEASFLVDEITMKNKVEFLRKPNDLYVYICCDKHGFITRVPHQVLQ